MHRIGIMASFREPTKLATITSLIAKSYGIEVIYMRVRDVNIEEKKVYGKVFVNNQWIEKKTDIPPFIDVVPYCFKRKNKRVMDFLRKETFLSDDRSNVITKEKLQNILSEDNEFSHLMIPTHKFKTFDDMYNYLISYNKVVLKPGKGIQGKGIYFIEAIDEDMFKIGFNRNKWEVNLHSLKEFFEDNLERKNYILQKYVTSRTLQGEPFDCRVHVEKDGSGGWSIAKAYIRIGIGQSVISNVNQGGGISDPTEFLKANFGEDWEDIYENLLSVGRKIPVKMEQLRKTHIMSLGMDIGINRDGKLYLFEVNDGPATKALISEVAFHRSNYYKYILKNKLNYTLKDPINMLEDNNKEIIQLREENKMKDGELAQLKNELAKKEKRINDMLNSTSWKVTGILRKTKKLLKK
ncbi:YheC/YheD family protein [Oceanobacillus oncorhynchi]|uniref:YheC/YheD family protein n=1 Tax=Oceanobacillus oncorhynchi TaxID=545501 RepID=UPI001867E83F|nr:YheC/YheD family protein [Oceanobacillus oncorhynchi]